MSWKLILRLAELAVTAILATSLFVAWRAERNDRAKLAADLAAAQQLLTQATDRQHSRDTDLVRTLAGLAAQKRSIQTPQQILKSLPQEIPLPQPIVETPLQPLPVIEVSGPTQTPSTIDSSIENRAKSGNGAKSKKLEVPEPQVVIPTADLKPLYDFALDCKACQDKLIAAQADLADEKSKTATLTEERDEAVRMAKGGSTLQRAARAAKWLLIGAAVGTLTARATR